MTKKQYAPYARWVAYLEDGETITQSREDGKHWYKIPHAKIVHMGIIFDSQPLLKPRLGKDGKPLQAPVMQKYIDPKTGEEKTRHLEKKLFRRFWDPKKKQLLVELVRDSEGKPIKKKVYKPVMDSVRDKDTGKPIGVIAPPMLLRGSSKFKYHFFYDDICQQKLAPGAKLEFLGCRVGMIIDKIGHCVCVEAGVTRQPIIYFTTVWSLGMTEDGLARIYCIKIKRPKDVIIEAGL